MCLQQASKEAPALASTKEREPLPPRSRRSCARRGRWRSAAVAASCELCVRLQQRPAGMRCARRRRQPEAAASARRMGRRPGTRHEAGQLVLSSPREADRHLAQRCRLSKRPAAASYA
ncbi:hypothetical protein PVAP13_3KG475201 [Panicum virgatum]|uniref:Uncharacterized protein n=1 Tax=Panicum virgatum TaxID=38727 RepID=A0A8T0V546_PANVG|nr:hypothetical protein PVAP13_3KG475201 [Panicum virgatum]